MAQTGTFTKGIYTTVNANGKKINKDAYEAVWEAVHGKPLVYPKTAYTQPVFINPETIEWEMTPYRGVSRKVLGNFSNSGTRLNQFLIESDAEYNLEENCLYFVECGRGDINGTSFTRHTSVHVKPGEIPLLKAEDNTLILQMGLPGLG